MLHDTTFLKDRIGNFLDTLDDAGIKFESLRISESARWNRGEKKDVLHISISFYMQNNTAESFRALKHLFGNVTVSGSPPYSYSEIIFHGDNETVHVFIPDFLKCEQTEEEEEVEEEVELVPAIKQKQKVTRKKWKCTPQLPGDGE